MPHRLVAVAVAPRDLPRDSSLVAGMAGVDHIDLLLLTDGDDDREEDGDDGGEDDPADRGAALRAEVAAIGIPGLTLHRLALRTPVRLGHVDDIVAAISELVGFDPEPGVACLVPSATRRDADGSTDAIVGRAVERIVAVYRLPLLTYRPTGT